MKNIFKFLILGFAFLGCENSAMSTPFKQWTKESNHLVMAACSIGIVPVDGKEHPSHKEPLPTTCTLTSAVTFCDGLVMTFTATASTCAAARNMIFDAIADAGGN